MADYPKAEYTTDEVRRAGEIVASDLSWTPENA
jgi:hypothetical protein